MCEFSFKQVEGGKFTKSTDNPIPIVLTFFWALIILVIFCSPLLAEQETEQKNVLVLASYSPTVPVADFWDKGIRSILDASSTPPVKIDIEHLYHHRIQDQHYRRLLVDLFHYKYSKEKPDLVIALYSGALDFELEVGSDLFQDIHAELKAYENTFDYFDVKLIPFNVKDIKFEAVGVLGDEINKGVAIRCK